MKMILTAAFAASFMLCAASVQAQGCTPVTESEMKAKYPPGQFFLVSQDELIDDNWTVVGSRILIGNPKTGAYVEIAFDEEGNRCATEFSGDPRKGEDA